MTVYKRPGVYIEESLTPLAVAAADPGEAAAAFVGVLPQGPTRPTKVTSWSAFQSLFGGWGNGKNYLPYAVYQYFNNGGRAAWIVRAVASDSATANVVLQDRQGSAKDTLKISAVSAGGWANGITVAIADAGTGTGRFDLTVTQGTTTERWPDLSLDASSGRYALSMVNSPVSGSSLVRLQSLHTETYDPSFAPSLQTGTPLALGADGSAAADLVAAAKTLTSETQENLNINLPGVSDGTIITPLVTWAESTGRVFVVIDLPKANDTDSSATVTSSYLSAVASYPVSSYAAVYGPWVQVNDPSSLVNGSMRLLPPGGSVLGQYSRIDASTGVQKPPAGITTTLGGALDVQTRFANTDQDSLYDKGVNLIKVVPGAGIVIWGARTLKPGNPDRFISVRRTLIMVKKALQDSTLFAVYEPNNADLWTRLAAVITQYLTGLQQGGVLKGSTPEQAFYVICDETNNPASSAQQGIVNIEIGVALSSPAEFVIIKIGQFDGGSTASDSTDAA